MKPPTHGSAENARRCDWFERVGVLALEREKTMPEHLSSCGSCRERREEIAALVGDLAGSAEVEPPADWQTRVWARIDAGNRRRWQVNLWAFAAGGGAVAALILSLAREPPPPPTTSDPGPAPSTRLLASVEPAAIGARARGSHGVGDILVLSAEAIRQPHVQVRVYRDLHALILQCSSEPPCERGAAGLRVRVPLSSPGTYRAVFIARGRPIEAASGSFDRDTAPHVAAQEDVRVSRDIEVW